jgi:hypothetical protein
MGGGAMRQCHHCGRMVRFNRACVCVLIRGNPHAYIITYTHECVLWEAIGSCDATGPKKEREESSEEVNDDDE